MQDAVVAMDAMPPVAGSATKAIMVVQALLNGSSIVLSTNTDGNLVLTAAASGAGSPAQAPALAPGASLSQSLPVNGPAGRQHIEHLHHTLSWHMDFLYLFVTGDCFCLLLETLQMLAPQALGSAFAQAATALPASPSPRPASPAAAAAPAQAPASAAHSLAAAFPLPHIVPAPASVPRAAAQYDEPALSEPAAAQRLAPAQSASDHVAPELLSVRAILHSITLCVQVQAVPCFLLIGTLASDPAHNKSPVQGSLL